MNDYSQKNISVTAPVSEAIEKTKILLFRPFDLGKWFVLGFSAWLMTLCGQGGGGGNFNPSSFNQSSDGFDQVGRFISENLVMIISIASGAFVFITAIILLMLWLSSRGHFMFLDCIAQNKAEIKKPWRNFKTIANSLFKFRILFGIITFLIMVVFLAPAIIGFIALKDSDFIAFAILGIVVGIGFCVLFGIITAMAGVFLRDFVIPIMYIRRCKVIAAWKEFLPLLGKNFWRFVLYLLFKIVIGMAIGMIVMAIICFGCCLCCIPLILISLPYIGTVSLLPLISFLRLYPVCYLRQFGDEFDVFTEPVDDIPIVYHQL